MSGSGSAAVSAADLADRLLRALAPAPDYSPTEWAAANLIFSERSSPWPGPYDPTRAPYLRQPVDDFADPECERITLCFAAQTGKTTILQIQAGYAIDHAPGPALHVMGNEDQAKRYSVKRWLPLIDDCPALARHKPTNPDLFRILEQSFDRMSFSLVGSNSPTNLASTPIRYLWLDETDKYPRETEREAPAVDLAEKRTRAFEGSRKIVKASTPSVPDGEIWLSWLAGDRRQFLLSCPKCGTEQTLEWRHILIPKSARVSDTDWDLDRVREETGYSCAHCRAVLREPDRAGMLAAGRWVASRPPRSGRPARHRSYHLSALYPLHVKWGELAAEWLEVHRSPPRLKGFVQGSLAEPWEERGETASADRILARRSDYLLGTCPVPAAKVARLILTADVQKHVCWYSVRAWTRDETSYQIEYGCVVGLEGLGEIAASVYDCAGGGTARVTNKLIDSGSFTEEVYAFCGKHRWVPTKGFADSQMDQPIRLVTLRRRNLPLLKINVDHYKDALQSRLAIAPDDPGAWHLASDCGSDYSDHLTAEEQIRERNRRTGRTRTRWKQVRDANHLLDCEVAQIAAAQWLGVRRRRPPPAGPNSTTGADLDRPGFVRRRRHPISGLGPGTKRRDNDR